MNIFVGNLNYNLEEEELQTAFAEFGEVSSVKIIKDKYSGRAKGFGFVEMPNAEEANAAIGKLDGTEVGGRALKVNEAHPPKPRTY
ncbi:MAG: RNA-binding protein [Bacteroidia bacterium]|nr:RNA-binding protein [Bacteroidia bacterium]NNC85113.1 RNA-binding protein [Bacteroidia bacterium]NNM15948.1 RNA-binding protein [Bacteroidia bacterium]